MKAETAAVLAVFGHLRNSNVFLSGPNQAADANDIKGALYTTHISYSWQDQDREFYYTLRLTDYDHTNERLELEIKTNDANIRAEVEKQGTRQYSISFSDTIGDNSDVVPWFKIDKDAKYIHDGYHQNADAGEEGPFTGTIELDGLRAVLNGYYNNEEVEYVVKILE